MAVLLNKMKKSRSFQTIALICFCLVLVLIGGNHYIDSLRGDVMRQAISNVLTATKQQQQAFDIYISGDRDWLHSLAQHLAKSNSTDCEEIRSSLHAFAEMDASYSVINQDNGTFYNNKRNKTYRMYGGELAKYRALSGSGVRDPYMSLYTADLMFGYYECFTFADGVRALCQKGYDCTKVSAEFSLSFYNGQGHSYLVTRTGDILLRPVDKSDKNSFNNIFDMVTQSGENIKKLHMFAQALGNRETGTISFTGEGVDYFYTYVPMENVQDWYLISVVPIAAVTQAADEIVMNSQATLLLFLVLLAVFLTFILLIWINRKDLEEKDLEIQYRERQFEIFSTYLSNNTDDIYMMLDSSAEWAEYISPNIERVLGIPEDAVAKDIRVVGRATYLNNDSVELETLKSMEPGDSMSSMLTERQNFKTRERKWFRESVYCVSMQDQKKIIVYISDRTKERKIQDTLSQALDMAQVANKAKSSFLGSVSHDIRTPMNAIMGLVMLLREEADDPERVLEYTQRIDAASQHLLGLINDVLDMNKIEGGATLNISELNLPDIIDELNTIIRPQARAKKQAFHIYATSFSHEYLLGDKLRINQVLINILSNAVKYTPEGGKIEMYVSELPQVMKDYLNLQFIIKDNGQGMSEEYLKVIFDPFTREQNSATNKIQGTGLGMAITKSLVELMGGTIKVESALGKGSTFTLNLQLRIQETTDDPKFWSNHGVTKMIVADDDEEICRNIMKGMSKTGVMVQCALSGQEAIEKMRTAREAGEPFDLMLLDWKMPDLDGLETARLIRQNYPKLPILFFTAYDWNDIAQEAIEVGVEHFLPKPFFMHTFKEAIQRMMGGRKRQSIIREDSVVEGMHILVVDDVEVNRMILVKILGTLGATCETAENGQIALDKFNESAPGDYDLILMDVQMPVLDGHSATRAIRASQHPDAKQISIIAMTANAFVDDVRDALAAGMDAHVSKPIVLDQLKATIQDVLSRKEL